MTFAEFHNALRILASIDRCELIDAGALSDDDTGGWLAFRDDPWRWFVRAGDDEARAVWRIIEARQPKRPLTQDAARAEMRRLEGDAEFRRAYIDRGHPGHAEAVRRMTEVAERANPFAVGKAEG